MPRLCSSVSKAKLARYICRKRMKKRNLREICGKTDTFSSIFGWENRQWRLYTVKYSHSGNRLLRTKTCHTSTVLLWTTSNIPRIGQDVGKLYKSFLQTVGGCHPWRKPIFSSHDLLWSIHSLNLMKVSWMNISMANNKTHGSRCPLWRNHQLVFFFLYSLLYLPFNWGKRFLKPRKEGNLYIHIYIHFNC